jgi:predicted NBD/HSP70 family sugar kinase
VSDSTTGERGPLSRALARGTNQSGVRLYNERLVLSLIRRRGQLPKADLARMTGLSPQTVSMIVNALETDGLLARQSPLRGKVGQPLVPYSLNPRGAFFLGLKIGRRSSDMVLLDFAGTLLERIHEPHPYPTPASIRALASRGLDLTARLSASEQQRISGLGIASPFEIWNWKSQFAAPPEVLEDWRLADIRADLADLVPWPVYFHNDGTAACAAELVLGQGHGHGDFLYMFLGSFIGGGTVLDGHLRPGRSGYAGAIGPMPIPRGDGSFQQVLERASIYVLAERLSDMGRDPSILWRDPDDWGDLGQLLDTWIEDTGRALALTCVAAASITDFETFVIDGACPAIVRERLVAAARESLGQFDLQGISPFSIVEGSIGSAAREMGGACLPLLANFSQDREVLFKDAAAE